MAQFKSDYFKFNGVSSDRYNLRIVNIGGDGLISSFGTDRSVVSENGVSSTTPVFYGCEDKCQSVTLELFHCDKSGNPIVINDVISMEISRWLFKKEPKPLECNGVVYYGTFTNGKKWMSGGGVGYFTLTFEMASSIAWSAVTKNPHRIIKNKTIEVYNKSTYDEYVYPDIECEMISGNSIKITNITTGQIVEISDVQDKECFKLYNDGVKQIVSMVDPKRNLFKLFNKEWLYLRYGVNILKIEVTEANVNIVYQSKIQLY